MPDESDRNSVVRFIQKYNSWLLPAIVSGLLHGTAAWVLLGNGWQEPAVNTPAARIQTQLMTLTYEMAAAEPEPPPVAKPSPPTEPAPALEPALEQAALARQRLEEDKQRQEQQRLEKQRAEQRRQQEEQKLAEQRAREEQRVEQQRLARQAEQQRLDAEAQARAQADAEAAAMAQYQPINKAPPAYPRRALDNRTEGDCTVTYTVTPDGRVSKPQVVKDACDDPIFIRPSLEAARAFRYQPRIVNGRAVAVHDVRNTFRYRIQ